MKVAFMLPSATAKHAFSLVELSIVLVILGLLVGGVISGKSLIRASGLRGVTTEYQGYATAIRAFRDKYFAIPGDMPNATAFWGAAVAGNGNGDGIIGPCSEMYYFWQNVANAGLITGRYTGVAGPAEGCWDCVIGTNVAASKVSKVGWTAISIVYEGTSSPAIGGAVGGGGFGYAYKINQLQVGKENGNYWTDGAFMTTEELWSIDTKIDDGKPGTGALLAARWNTCTDASNEFVAASGAANYRLSNTASDSCAMLFMPSGTGLQ